MNKLRRKHKKMLVPIEALKTEREARNQGTRRTNAELTRVSAERDRYRQQLWDGVTSLNEARAKVFDLSEELRASESARNKAEEQLSHYKAIGELGELRGEVKQLEAHIHRMVPDWRWRQRQGKVLEHALTQAVLAGRLVGFTEQLQPGHDEDADGFGMGGTD